MADPTFTTFHAPSTPRGIVLVLHGGQAKSEEPVEMRHASWWRMKFVATSLIPMARDHDLLVVLLRYRKRGWNDVADPDPVTDARWALEQLTEEHPGLPVALVGHSMGGRTACHVADHRQVRGVCALAPWLPTGEPNDAVRDRLLRVMHGTRDRWTSAAQSKAYVERSRVLASSASWESMPGAGHFMLRHVRSWNRFVKHSVEEILGLTYAERPPS